jgi:hypothetical protein
LTHQLCRLRELQHPCHEQQVASGLELLIVRPGLGSGLVQYVFCPPARIGLLVRLQRFGRAAEQKTLFTRRFANPTRPTRRRIVFN